MLDFDVQPNANFMRLLNFNDAQVREVVAVALNEAGLFAQDLIVQSTPVDTARLRNSWTLEIATPDDLEAVVFTNVEYAPYVEFGTGVHSENPASNKQPIFIKAKNKKALKFTSGGETFFRKSVTIQGMKPRSMIRRNIPVIEQKLNETLRKHLTRFLSGGQ